MENINDFDSVRDEQQAIQNSTPSERTHTHTQDFSHLSQPNNQAASESTAPDETVINNGINSASEGVETSPYLPPTLDKPLQLAPATQLAGGKKENPIEPKKPIEPKPIAKNHAIFILPPHKWDKSQITKTATDTSYIVENVWIREQVGADNKITYHYYQAGYDINEALCWQYFEPQTEQKVSTETDIPLVTVEERRYTPEELAAIKQRRRELMYAIASDEKLFFQFYLNENYSQEFRTQLYHMKIAIGRGEVAMVVAGVGFSFMAMAAAPVLIEGAMALPSVSASALKSIASTGVNAAKGIARGMKSAKDMAMAALKDMPKDMLKGTLIDKVGEAIGIPLGILFDLRDAKEIVRDLGKYWAKNPNPKLLTPDGHEIDLDSPMQFSKDKTPIKGGKSTNWPWTKDKASKADLLKDGGKCFEHAKKIKSEIGGEIIHIKDGFGAPAIGPVYNSKGELITSDWKEHYAVRIGDVIYDRITGSEGLHIDEYKKLFEYGNAGLIFDNFIKQ